MQQRAELQARDGIGHRVLAVALREAEERLAAARLDRLAALYAASIAGRQA